MLVSPRAGLDRAIVVRTAAEMADAAGGEVTLAALAAGLGVRTPSLYNHVAGQEGLRRELKLLGLRELMDCITRAAVGKSVDDALMAVADAYRGYARRRPGVYPLTQAPPDPDDAETMAVAAEIVELLSVIMDSYQLDGNASIHAIRGLRSLLHGFATLEANGGFGIPVDVEESFSCAVQVFIRGLRDFESGSGRHGPQ